MRRLSTTIVKMLQGLDKQRIEKETRHREHASIRRQLEDTASYMRSVKAQEALAVQIDALHAQAAEVCHHSW